MTEVKGGTPKMELLPALYFLIEALNDVLRNTRIISYGIGVGVKVGLEDDK
ncbi:hypothetical protein [Peribacillus frigoritolerans]|uniref:hypothetical protein n=1 Tax=Peribacillus frigoritolerans TaxID=450367 RepID=UPI002079ABB2|nr:hypothetical protein [Peribacillus frigoritolerans]USK74083.1 hypothetical protein LIT31_20055 [Peribacillus frigoritolerans]